MDYSPGDIVHVKRDIGSDRYFFIEGVCLGGEGQRDVISVIFADDQDLPACHSASSQFEHREVHHIPVSMFEASLTATHVEVYERFEEMENPVFSE